MISKNDSLTRSMIFTKGGTQDLPEMKIKSDTSLKPFQDLTFFVESC